jgi:DNA polymerase-3 subunit epsilon
MIVLDTETTGLDPRQHSLLSIGAIDFDNPENEFYGECRAFDGAEIDSTALAINGFTEGEARGVDVQTDGELLQAFIRWTATVGDSTLAGMNPAFDISFLQATAKRTSIEFPFSHRLVDLHSIAYAHMLGKGIEPPHTNASSALNTEKIFTYVGLPGRDKAHNAHEDAILEAEALSRLIYGRVFIEDLSAYPVPAHLKRS